MNRRTIVIAIAAAAVALFAGGAVFYLNRPAEPPAALETPITAPAPATADAPAPDETAAVDLVPEDNASAENALAPRWNVYVREHSPVIGAAQARVTIVEFFDPACEACRAFYPIVHEILRRHPGDVRLVLRYTPLHGPPSEEAVRIIETARMQNKFEPVLNAIFQQQPQWAAHEGPRMELAWNAAAGAGLDVATARAAMNARHINAAISQDVADAAALNVRGTPTFFVNERPLINFGPQQLYDLVLAELAATE